jgi:predicted permease
MLLIILCLLAGLLLNKVTAPCASESLESRHEVVSTVLNAVVIYVALPAMTIVQIHRIQVDRTLLIVASGPWLNFLFAAVFWGILGPALGWGRPVTGMMILATGLGNTSFLGFPLIEALLGSESLPIAVVSDQLGSFIVVSTLGIIVANFYGTSSDGKILLRILRFPPFMAMIVALMTRHLEFHSAITSCLERLATLLTPLALMSVGSRLSLDAAAFKHYRYQMIAGLSFKMLLVPVLTLCALKAWPKEAAAYQNVMVLESAMPGMITGYLVGAQRGLDSKLGALLISTGIAIALLSIPAWAWFLNS